MKFIIKYIFVFLLIIIAGCSDSTVINNNSPQTETLIYQKPGLVDSLVGTCSAYMVRTLTLDSIDTRNFNSVRVEMTAFTDGDLSNINIYYLNSGNINNIVALEGTGQINSSINYNIPSPKIRDNFYIRLRLFSSVCTGQLYHLKIRDLKIFGVN
jgi:hypothetical protein